MGAPPAGRHARRDPVTTAMKVPPLPTRRNTTEPRVGAWKGEREGGKGVGCLQAGALRLRRPATGNRELPRAKARRREEGGERGAAPKPRRGDESPRNPRTRLRGTGRPARAGRPVPRSGCRPLARRCGGGDGAKRVIRMAHRLRATGHRQQATASREGAKARRKRGTGRCTEAPAGRRVSPKPSNKASRYGWPRWRGTTRTAKRLPSAGAPMRRRGWAEASDPNGTPATGHRPPATGHRLQATGYGPQATGYGPQATGNRPPATGYPTQTGLDQARWPLRCCTRTRYQRPAPTGASSSISTWAT